MKFHFCSDRLLFFLLRTLLAHASVLLDGQNEIVDITLYVVLKSQRHRKLRDCQPFASMSTNSFRRSYSNFPATLQEDVLCTSTRLHPGHKFFIGAADRDSSHRTRSKANRGKAHPHHWLSQCHAS